MTKKAQNKRPDADPDLKAAFRKWWREVGVSFCHALEASHAGFQTGYAKGWNDCYDEMMQQSAHERSEMEGIA